ncbi:MAG: TerB family tellurite resistance protein [Bacteroidota bacterium]
MKTTEKLIDAFGEFIYVVAMADGQLQEAELATIREKLAGHKWGESIQWSFDYEVKKRPAIEDLYKKVISYCEVHGPDPEYQFLIEVAEAVANADNRVDASEQAVIDSFSADLIKAFKADIERINA